MKKRDFITEIEIMLSESPAALLSTNSAEGYPHTRWMTPLFLKDRTDNLYAITEKSSSKAQEVEQDPRVSWTIQSPALDRIATIEGSAKLVDNSSLKSEIMEVLGNKLNTFWTVHGESDDFIVIETAIGTGTFFHSRKNRITTIKE